ncbi:MIR motif-containing protein [Mycena vulgaris]|nr:MIR motif-containing protein [Mycena vulgaris]
MSRSILSSLSFVLISGFCFLALYNIQTARFHSQLHFHTSKPEAVVSLPPVLPILFGSTVTVRHVSARGGYLHSQALNYPTGSHQQLVALAPQRSNATKWRIYNAPDYLDRAPHAPRTPIVDATALRLQHPEFVKHLHSHDVVPPVSAGEYLQEVSAYGMPGFDGDANDDWVLELTEGSTTLTMASPVRLRHRLTRCLLASGGTLPAWGFGLQEVVCARLDSEADLWTVEEVL